MKTARRLVSVFGVEPARIGGTEIFARELSLRLAERGWQNVLCFHSQPEGDVRRFLELPNVSFQVLKDTWKFHWKPARDLAAILRKNPAEILHLHYTSLLSPYPWIARYCGVEKVFYTDHSSQPEGFVPVRRPLWKRLTARAFSLPLDRVICPSDYNLRSMLQRDLIDAARVLRIYNGVDLALTPGDGGAFRQRHGVPPDALVVAQVSWMIPEKGIVDVIEAARMVLARVPDAHFLLAGEGAHRQEYMAMARGMGMGAHFTWTGLLQNPVAEGLYAAADVVCQASRWEEAFGWTITEAMAVSKPLVATRVGGIPELVEDGVTGFLVAPRAPAEIADRVVRLLADAPLRKRMGEAGRQAAERKFDLQHNLDELMQVYGLG